MKYNLITWTLTAILFSIFIAMPGYALYTGSAELIPYVTFFAYLFATLPIVSLICASVSIWRAERRADIHAHNSAVKLAGIYGKQKKIWLFAFFVRHVAFYLLLIALGLKVEAIFVALGLSAALYARYLTQSYASRLPVSRRAGASDVLDKISRNIGETNLASELNIRIDETSTIDGVSAKEYIEKVTREVIEREANAGGAIWSAQRRV